MAPGIYNILGGNDLQQAIKYSQAHSSNIVNKTFADYGYIYINYYSNIILLLPLVIYYVYKKIKDKSGLSFEIILLLLNVIFIELLIIGILVERVSVYFTMKNYYALWIVLIFTNFKGLMNVYEKKPKVSFSIYLSSALVNEGLSDWSLMRS